MIGELVWNGFRRTAAETFSTQGMRDWWQSYRSSYSERFSEYIDELISGTPLVTDATWLKMRCDDAVGEEYWNQLFRSDASEPACFKLPGCLPNMKALVNDSQEIERHFGV